MTVGMSVGSALRSDLEDVDAAVCVGGVDDPAEGSVGDQYVAQVEPFAGR